MSDEPEAPDCACCEQPLTDGFIRLWPSTSIRVCYDCLDWMNSQRERQTERASGSVQVIGHEPIFTVADVARSVEHYQRLGFKTDYHDDTYAFASLGQLTLHLAQDGGEGWPGYHPDRHMTSVMYLHVEDADQVAADWRAAGATVHGPQDEDYGKREGQLIDPDGNLIRFGSPLAR